MSQVAIVTDTDSSLPPALAAKYDIRQVPITIHFGDETFFACQDIDDRTLFERIDRYGKLPTTAAPAPSAFVQAFQEAFDAGASSVVCICVSSKISATYHAALAACEQLPGKLITVIDSLSLSMGQGQMVLAAAEAAKTAASHEAVVASAQALIGRTHVYGTLTTLKYLAMSGRVGKLAAGMANMLNIRPILRSNDGKLEMLEKVRTRKTAMERLVSLVQDAVRGKSLEQAAVVHVNNLTDANELIVRLRACLPIPEEVVIAEFTPGLSVHAGSGLVGVAFVTGD